MVNEISHTKLSNAYKNLVQYVQITRKILDLGVEAKWLFFNPNYAKKMQNALKKRYKGPWLAQPDA